MFRGIRSVLIGVLAATFLVALVARSTTPLQGQGPAAPPTAEQIAPFVGDWLVSLAMQSIEVSLAVVVKSDAGKVSATIGSQGQPTINVTDISMSANRLVLKYVTEAMGTALPTVLTLTPEGPGLRANMAIMDGQYQMSGAGTKQAPGAPVRATGFGGGRGAAASYVTDFSPKTPYLPRTPAEQAAGFMLPTGYRMELIAA